MFHFVSVKMVYRIVLIYMMWLLHSQNDFIAQLKGAVQLDHSKDMLVLVSTCTSYSFNALMPVV